MPQAAGNNGHAAAVVARQDHKTVFVRNVSFEASDAEVADFFSQAGQVAQVRRQIDDQGQCLPLAACVTLWHQAVVRYDSNWVCMTAWLEPSSTRIRVLGRLYSTM